ncbi:putative ent-kaurene synthase [Helianthus anomalus]
MSVMGRLLNDIFSFMREIKEELNAIELQLRNGESATGEEEVIKEITTVIKKLRKEIMKLVTEEKGSVVPRACKDVFLNMSNVLNLFYATDDGFTVRRDSWYCEGHLLRAVELNGSEEQM